MRDEESSFIEGINEQQPSAYHQLYNEYYRALALYALNFLSSLPEAEDIVQELFATIWEKKMKFFSLSSFRSYLYNSVRNASLNYLKHQNVESLYLERLAETYQEFTEEDTMEEEVYRLLFRTIDKLPKRCREVLLLHMDGKKNEEIAAALKISIETVKTQKKRAMRFLREQMNAYYFLLPLCVTLYDSEFFS